MRLDRWMFRILLTAMIPFLLAVLIASAAGAPRLHMDAQMRYVVTLEDKASGKNFCAGVVYAPSVVVTARHCVADIPEFVLVWKDGSRRAPMGVLLSDTDDVAFVRFGGPAPFTPERGGRLRFGDIVVAIGSPLGVPWVVTQGEVVYNDISLPDFSTDWVLATVPVQPGNSGGPVFDANGDLIGIVSMRVPMLRLTLILPVETIRAEFRARFGS